MAIGAGDGDSSLHLPRILCLHGGGTNARIFRMQCRAFKYHIGHEFRFVYAQAPFPTKPGPDVTSVYSEYGPFRGWVRPVNGGEDPDVCAAEASILIQKSINTAISADNELGATGEVVGLLGFSQGARIAASLLYNQQVFYQRSGRTSEEKSIDWPWPNFRFAVLLAGRGKLVWLLPDMAMPEGCDPPLQPSVGFPVPADTAPGWDDLQLRNKLRLPTVHVHGVLDDGLDFHRQMALRYCVPDSSTVMEWDGEHRVPIKTKDVIPVAEQMLRLSQ
ncbi:hypothetical protein CDD83_6955 [Cordyceps sp. RAO-2017]|nr:hypothetical protein CDD83_6955 [Cordyceps sp. RAO-2017]